LPEHKNAADCGCWGCQSIAREGSGVCVVHLVAEQDQVPPAVVTDQNLCPTCDDRMRADLHLVAERWEEAQAALHPSRGGDSERHAQRTEAPLPLNVSVSDALMIVRDNIWSVALRLVDDHPGLSLPADQTTPSLAEWLARWQMLKIAGAKDKGFTRQAYWWVAEAADQIASKTYGTETTAEIPNQFCKRPGCKGKLFVAERSDGVRTVRCAEDANHAVQWDTWSKMLKASRPQRRGARPPRLGRV